MKTTTFFLVLLGLLMSPWLPAQEVSSIEFNNEEIELTVNDSIALSVKLITDSSEVEITDLTFYVLPDSLGKVENNTFYALKPGKGWIMATYESYTDSIEFKIEALDDDVDTEEPSDSTVNDDGNLDNDTIALKSVFISRVLPSGKVLPAQEIKEGQTYVIGGLPSPMNILNGGEVLFPVGSLKEDITIHIELPKFAEVGEDDSVRFKNKKVLNSIAFHVYVADSLVSPYYFELPLEVAIPFKRGLIKNLGLDPAKLSLFYASDSLELDQDGISDVYVDSAANLIRSKVAHFSNLVIAESSVISTISPVKTETVSIYPNPANDMFILKFNENLEGVKTVKMFNLMGQIYVNEQINSNELQFDISSFPVGVYLVKVTDQMNNMIYSGPLMKK